MRWFTAGFTLCFAMLTGLVIRFEMLWDALTEDYALWVADGFYQPADIGVLLVVLGILPPLAAFTVASFFQSTRGVRMFDRRRPGIACRVFSGAVAGIIALAFTIVGLALAHEQVADWFILTAASTIGTVGVLLFSPRLRRGHCLVCDYDLHACVGSSRCPECGAVASMA